MDFVQKHWKPISIGSTAVALSALLYYYSTNSTSQKIVVDINDIRKRISKTSWPQIRRVVDPSLPRQKQQIQLQKWLDNIFKEYIRQRGSIKTNDLGHLEFTDLMELYNVIEAMGRFELQELRENNQGNRMEEFKKCFIDHQEQNMVNYLNIILINIDEECDNYTPALEKVLKLAKVKQLVWESSLEVNMPQGAQFIQHATIASQSSPLVYHGSKTKQEILDIYRNSVLFAISQLGNNQT